MNFISGTVNVIVHYLLMGEKKNHPRPGAFARIFHVGNYGSWKKNKSQNSLTFYIVHEANFNFHIKVMHAIF